MERRLPIEKHFLVVDNLNLVHYTLRSLHLHPNYPDYDDYFQEGCVGLIKAAIGFDDTRGFAFSTYAVPQIRGYVQRYRRDKCNVIRIRRSDYDTYVRMVGLMTQGYELEDLPEMLGVSPLRVAEIINAYSLDSLDSLVAGKDDTRVAKGDLIADWRNEYEDLMLEQSLDEAVNKVLSKMKEPSRSICEEWFWAKMFGEDLTQNYFADKYRISQAQVSRCMNKFKDNLLFYLGMEM